MQNFQLSYLEQLSELLEDKYKSQCARLGYISKQIREKHVVHVKGADPPKIKHCKSCQAMITCNDVISRRRHKILIKCPLCNYSKHMDTWSGMLPENQTRKEKKFNGVS